MKIERVDDKTLKCYLSNEELEQYQIDYKDFLLRSDKAREVVQDIIIQAQEEVGYQPPRFAFDLQIMMVPEQGMVLTFQEKDTVDLREGQMILEYLKEVSRALQKAKEQMEEAGKNPPAQPVQPDFAVFAFKNPGRVMEYASALPRNLRVKSALYRMNDVYYLWLQKGRASYERYSRICVQALEFGSLFAAEEDRLEYLREHGDCLIAEGAIRKLRMN